MKVLSCRLFAKTFPLKHITPRAARMNMTATYAKSKEKRHVATALHLLQLMLPQSPTKFLKVLFLKYELAFPANWQTYYNVLGLFL